MEKIKSFFKFIWEKLLAGLKCLWEKIKNFFWFFIGAFVDKDGTMSTSKVLAFVGYIVFLAVSVILALHHPEKLSYDCFAILSAGSATSLRIIDKYLNVINGKNETK